MIDEWDGKEIIYPDDLVFTTMGEDTVKWFLKDSRYTIVTYAEIYQSFDKIQKAGYIQK